MSKEKTMSWAEAIEAMERGKTVRNEYFTREEWFEMRNGRLFAEDGCPMDGWFRGEDWQRVGWSVVGNQ